MPVPLSQGPNVIADSGLPPFIPAPPIRLEGLLVTAIKTADYNADYDQIVPVDPSDGVVSIILPTAVGHLGRAVLVKNASDSTNGVFISTTESIDGTQGATIDQPRGVLWLVSDNSAWMVTTSVGVTLGDPIILEG